MVTNFEAGLDWIGLGMLGNVGLGCRVSCVLSIPCHPGIPSRLQSWVSIKFCTLIWRLSQSITGIIEGQLRGRGLSPAEGDGG